MWELRGSILHVRNDVQRLEEHGSLIDPDTIYDADMPGTQFFREASEIFKEAHLAEKRLFFRLLSDELLESLNPEY